MAGSFDVGSVVARIEADVTQFKKAIGEVDDRVSGLKGGLQKLDEVIMGVLKVGMVAAGAAIAGAAVYLKSASEEATNLSKAMTTLEIISSRFGVSADDAKTAAKQLGQELRIGTGAAAESLQNLFKSGLNLEQSTDLLKRFTNEAMTGKSPTISLSQAVQNLSFAYATGNSALGNLSGINENFNDIIERGAKLMGKKTSQMTEAELAEAKYRGTLELTNLTLGSSEKFVGTLADKQAQLDYQMLTLKQTIGEQVNPAIAMFINAILESGIIEKIGEWATNQMPAIIAKLTEWGQWLYTNRDPIIAVFMGIINIVKFLTHVFTTSFMFIFNTTQWVIYGIVDFLEWLKASFHSKYLEIYYDTINLWTWIKKIFNDGVQALRDIGGQIKDALVKPFSEAWDRIKDLVNNIRDKIDFTKRQSPSVLDLINNGVKKANRAFEGLSFTADVIPNASGFASSLGINGAMMAQVQISLDGALIADDASAQRVSENIGNMIISKLQTNIRV